ncbi:hypothetical protein [Tateyamaria omphalii]|uniref:Uncharacterized protein n=1 Tax=Tateyamaria omphalii TaxID=299262 RepID=A0A1P8MZU7_9RHOB|nr:hypothetical protein [Tateyamaria omphalii]APX13553.1 hypothetical protein BWR18_19085 [Tateyamaria omphalii]
MSIISIFGGGGGSPQPVQQPSNQQQTEDSTDQTSAAANESQDSGAATSGNAAQTQDTTAPAPATGADQSTSTAAAPPSDPKAEAARVTAMSEAGASTSAQAVVEAAIAETPEQIEADARRMAEAAQQQQRLEMLIEAVNTPVEKTALTAAAAEPDEVAASAQEDGTPV